MNLGSQTMINQLIARKALLVINHPRGKDSQAMMIEPLRRIPREQLLVVHASLGEITLSTEQVFATIAAAGQPPHPACTAGNERLPCVSCIMGPKGDIARGALARPELFARHVEPGQRTGHTMHMSRKPLTQLVAEAQLNPLPLAA